MTLEPAASSERSDLHYSESTSSEASAGNRGPSETHHEPTAPSMTVVAPAASSTAVNEAPRTRLVIRDIDVENFKSYYGLHTIGPFHKTFTAVIGPNGSGKSNVIDAMLFVFGRSAKKIRLEKLSELIHNSAANPHVAYASVTVNFVHVVEGGAQDPMDRVEVPGSGFRIQREVFRSGVSQYYIDNKRRTQKDVVECLIAHGVDLDHNRFLILQGEVEQIALMKPKAEKEGEEGLLEYLDDLIGTNEYVARIGELGASVETVQAARLEALDRERKLKAERDALEDAKNSTLAFVTKDNHLQKTLIVMCQIRMRGIEEKLVEPRRLLGEIDQRIQEYEEDLQTRRVDKTRADEEVARSKKALAETTKDRDALRQRKQAAEAQVEHLKSGVEEQDRAHKRITDHIKRCKEEMQKASLQQQDAEREAAIHQHNLEEAVVEVTSLQRKHDELSETLLPQLRPLRQQLEEKKRSFAPFEKSVVQADEQLRTAQSRVDALLAAMSKRSQEMGKLESDIANRTARLQELSKTLAEADTVAVREMVTSAQDTLTEATQRKFAINASIQEMKNNYREGEADDRAMEFLLSQRHLKGYYGTLRQLGRIDDEYDIAAGTASNAWGFHVVEDRATATAALEALKQNNIGRATMMVISEVDREMGERMQKPFHSPNPKAQRLFELIKPTNPKFCSVFYQAVRDTLVVSTLAEARETVFGGAAAARHVPPQQRHRVVTRKGELVEPTGTITGGGAAPRGAKLKAARSPQDKQAIKEELQRLQQELVQAAEDERTAQTHLHRLREKEQRFSSEEVRRLRTERHSLAATVEHDGQRLQTLRTELESLSREQELKRQKLLAVVEDCAQQLEKAKTTRNIEHQAIERLEEGVDRTGGAAFREVAENLKKQQARQEAEENALRACRRLTQKLRATQERKQVDITEYQNQLEQLMAEEREGVKEKVAEARVRLEELQRQLTAAESTLARAQSATEDARAAVPMANSALIESQRRLDDEHRYRQTEAAKIADALQELAKFNQKIEGCEEKIKENAELYGLETLQLEAHGDAAAFQEEEEEEEDEAGSSGSAEEEASSDDEERQASRKRHRPAGTRRPKEDEAEGVTASSKVAAMSFKLSPEELERCDYERSVYLAKALSEETKRLHSEIDFRAVALWRERDLAHRQALTVYQELKSASDEMERELLDLKEIRRAAFLAVFESIRQKLKEVYQLLTHGGDADMELVDVNDPFEGIQFVVRPPKKSWKQISNLSGGEKTLASLALIFSLHHIKPTPIYVMDEIDAALDFRNVSIVANYVLRQAIGAQFVIISLRNNMFEHAHQLVGVCKVNDVTSTLVLMPRAFEKVVQQAILGSRCAQHGEVIPGTPPAGEGERESLPQQLSSEIDERLRNHDSPLTAHVNNEERPRKSVRFSD